MAASTSAKRSSIARRVHGEDEPEPKKHILHSDLFGIEVKGTALRVFPGIEFAPGHVMALP